MKINTNWSIIPTHKIDVKELQCPYDISLFMKRHKIDKYLYQIMYKGVVIKFGMSADKSRNYGERIYRQIGHLRSWGVQRLNGSSGSDWRIVEEDFENMYGVPIEKDHVKIKIWDLSNYPFTTIDPWKEVLVLESQLISRYVEAVGEKPIGNINDEANAFRRSAIQTSTWIKLFEPVSSQ
jgi:hypothetical protein